MPVRQIRNQRLSDEEFSREREQVLAEWPTGKEVDLDEAVAYHKSQSPDNNYALKIAKAKQDGVKILHGSGGADTLERHIELIQYLQDEGHADAVSTWIDALTRNHRYGEADEAVGEAESTGKVVLNGFPIVHYGVAGTRKMTESINIPACVYANGPDMRLIVEIALAGGHTAANIGGSLCAFWGYTSNTPPEAVMRYYQYCYRLQGHYQEKGVPILNCITGTVSGLIAPSLYIVPSIIEALLAAEQGAKHIRLQGRGEGNLAQDIASLITLRKLGREYLDKLGHKDVLTYLASRHPSGRFPEDDAQAFVILGWGAIIGMLAGCEGVNFFTIDEGRQIPRKEPNAATHRHIRMIVNMLKDQEIDLLSNKAVAIETELVERETRAIMDKMLELGDGDVVAGTSRAIEAGVIDQPFTTNQRMLSKVLSVRDAQGAVRYLDHGNLPFTSDIVEFHKEKIAQRAQKEGREISYDAVIGDIFALSRGCLISSPSWQYEASVTTR